MRKEQTVTGLATAIVLAVLVISQAPAAGAELVIQASRAATRTEGGPMPGGEWNLWSNGLVGQPVRVPADGSYRVVIRAWGSPAANVWPEMGLVVDGRILESRTVDRDQPADYRFETQLAAGIHEIAAAFLNDAVIGREDRNLYLARLTIISPPARNRCRSPGSGQPNRRSSREREIVAATGRPSKSTARRTPGFTSLDAQRQPAGGVKLSVEQTSHAFLFGGNIYMFDRYQDEDRMPPTSGGSRSCSTTPRSDSTGDRTNRSAASRGMITPTKWSRGAATTGFV